MRNSVNSKLVPLILSILLLGNLLFPQNVSAAELSSIGRLAGDTSYQTALDIAMKLNPGIAPAVVLASPTSFSEALVAVPLAKQKEAPLLWVGQSPQESQDVLNFIKEHCDKKGTIYILGSENVISQSFESALQELGYNKEQIQRLGGKNHYETAVEIAQRIEYKGNPIYITTGEDYSQAVGAAVIAAVQESPILLLPSKSHIPKSVIDYLNKMVKEGATVEIIGNSKVLPDAVLSELKSKVKGLRGQEIKRLSGNNIYDLTAKVNSQIWLTKQALEEKTISWIFITSGKGYDSIPGAVLAAQAGAPLIFIDETIPKVSASLLKDIYRWNKRKDRLPKQQVTVLGGVEVIPQEAVVEADSLFTLGESMAGKAQVWTYAGLNTYSEPSYGVKGEGNTVIISDSQSHTLQMIHEDKITRLTGKSGALNEYGRPTGGYKDGLATEAMLNIPKGIAIDENGILYVADSGNGAIRTVDQQGNMKTLVKGLNYPTGIVLSATGDLYVTETLNHRILKINSQGQWTVLAGGGYTLKDGVPVGTFANGRGEKAKFNEPQGLDIDDEGNLYVADTGNQRIRKISPEGVVTTIAGSGTERIDHTSYILGGYKDGKGSTAKFNFPLGLAVGKDKTVYVADSFNHCIRKITPEGIVSTLAGTTEPGKRDGLAVRTQFNTPSDVLLWDNGNLLIVDQENALLRIYYQSDTAIH